MTTQRRPYFRYPLIISMTLCVHVTWAISLLILPFVQHITALYLFDMDAWKLAGLLLTSSGCSLCGLHSRMPRQIRALLCMPQQIILCMSALGAFLAAVHASYGDGVVHPRLFIFADQWPAMLLAPFHTFAIIKHNEI